MNLANFCAQFGPGLEQSPWTVEQARQQAAFAKAMLAHLQREQAERELEIHEVGA